MEEGAPMLLRGSMVGNTYGKGTFAAMDFVSRPRALFTVPEFTLGSRTDRPKSQCHQKQKHALPVLEYIVL